MKKLNILYLFGRKISIGGHFKSALSFVKPIISAGHNILMMSPGGIGEISDEFEKLGIKSYYLNYKKGYRVLPIRSVSDIIRLSKKHDIDIIHAQDFESLMAGYLSSILLNKKFIFTKPGGTVDDRVPPKNVQNIFYSQELIEGMVKKHRLIGDNLSLINERIDLEIYRPKKVDKKFIKKYDLPLKGKKIVTAIRLSKEKNYVINKLLQFSYWLKDQKSNTKVIIAGDGPLLCSLKKKAESINKKDKILYTIGPIFKSEDISQFFNDADVIIGNGRGLLEAMACKKPVIIIGENYENELINQTNIQEISIYNFSGRHFRHGHSKKTRLVDIISNKIKLKEASTFSFEQVKKFDSRIGAKKLLRIYNNLENQKYKDILSFVGWVFKLFSLNLRKILYIKNNDI